MKPVFAFALLSLTTVAGAQTPVPAPAASSAAPADKKVCRMQETATGSIMPAKRVCRLQSEWAAMAASDQRGVERFQEQRRLDNRPN